LKPFWAVSLLALGIAASGIASAKAAPEARFEKIEFKGWKNCYALTAGPYRVVVAAGIGGRIVDFSRDGTGPIWLNPDELGEVHPLDPKVWFNYGGYKTWPAPQSNWPWPPDPLLDAAPVTVKPWETGDQTIGLTIIGQESPKSGIAFQKYLKLDPKTGALHLWQEMRALPSNADPVKWAVWDITQVTADGWVVAPLDPKSKQEDGVYCYSPEYRKSKQWTTRDGLLLLRNLGETGKWGVETNGGWMARLNDRIAYVKRIPAMETGADYPDESSNVQIYTNSPPLSYTEMETTGPIRTLKPREKTVFEEEWRLVPLPKPVEDEDDAVEAIRFLRSKGVLKPLKETPLPKAVAPND
jgi:hypothetical protein